MKDRAYETAKNSKYDGYQRELEVWFFKFLTRKLDSKDSKEER